MLKRASPSVSPFVACVSSPIVAFAVQVGSRCNRADHLYVLQMGFCQTFCSCFNAKHISEEAAK